MVLTKKEVINHLIALIQFFKPVHSLGNSHFGSFFTEKLWEREVPVDLQLELNNIHSVKTFIQLYPQLIKDKYPNDFAENHPNLVTFLRNAVGVSINKGDKYLKLLSDLEKLIETKDHVKNCDIEMEEFMSPKKLHEVKVTSKMAALISNLTHSSHVVDIGGGKGYLSCILALHYSFKVLGLDSSEVTTCGAVKRSQKVAKIWTGDIFKQSQDKEIEMLKSTKNIREEFIRTHYKQFITFVSPQTNVEKLLKEGFKEDIAGITLVGLHTCGNLAPTSLQMFLKNKKIRGIINVGCCYHLISEEFSDDNTGKKLGGYSFPLSDFLKNEKYQLGRNARMLAAHSLDRINSHLDFDSSQTSVFYRAVLETVISENIKGPVQGQVGRLARKCNNFNEYMITALKKLNIDIQFTENDLIKLHRKYVNQKQFLTAFYLLRISLAPVVESIILLDRVLYLMENGINNVYLVPLFNLAISPRGFGIIAWKEDT